MSKTNTLILLCVLISLFAWGTSDSIARLLVFSTSGLIEGRIWTLVTALFVHADIIHLLGNMIFLYVFGNTLENTVKSRNMLLVFFTGGITTFLFGIPFYSPYATLVGASAAIFTLTAVVMIVKPLKFSWLFLLPVGLVAILYFLYNVLAVYHGSSGSVAYVSHVIGFLIGVPFGVAWSPKWIKNLIVTLCLLAIYLLIIAFGIPIIFDLIKKVLTNS